MTTSSACAACRDVLPWYAAGTASREERAGVERHLAACADCVRALDGWRTLAAAVRAEDTRVEPPLLLDASWERVSARLPVVGRQRATSSGTVRARPATWPGLVAAVYRLELVVAAQARLLRRSVWVASAIAIALAVLYAATLPSHVGEQDVLAFALPLVAATGMAFLYGPEIDPGLELALATPTSARAILLGRFALLFAYDTLLALAGTTLLSALRGGGFWSLTLVWLGPMALLSAISLALSLLLSAGLAAAGPLLLWLARIAHFDNGVTFRIVPEAFWGTNPLILAIALTLLIVVALYAPRQERLRREE